MTYQTAELADAAEVIRAVVAEGGLSAEEPEPGRFVVELPGEKRLKTACWLIVGKQGLSIEAFVVRKPDENHEQVYRWLLSHNARMFGVAWSVAASGDIFLTGRWPLAAVTAADIDRVLGSVLQNADDSFNTLLELGFGSSIRREWAWRTSRGESRANLAAFEAFIERTAD
ncbi:MAG: hypothetical protein JWN95_3158 [Frankiales bacterium]|nr:hypothetical protein [Frankiales bacterium]